MTALTWEDVTADPSLQHLPCKLETDGYNKIILSPLTAWQGELKHELSVQLMQHLPGGRVLLRPPVRTAHGVRVPDLAWISPERWPKVKHDSVMSIAPEFCVEILTLCNPREELLLKMTLYLAKGAQEVWLCDADGKLEFFTALSAPDPVPASVLCPDFPHQIDVD